MVTIEDGKYYILHNFKHPLLLHIMKMEDDEDTSYMRMYLFGGDDLAGEKHEFKTPQDLFVHYFNKELSKSDIRILAHATEFPDYHYSRKNKLYTALVKKKNGKPRQVTSAKFTKFVQYVLEAMPCESLEKIMKDFTRYEAVPVVCPLDNPMDLHVSIDEQTYSDEYVQIGYVIVDVEAMNEVTLYQSAVYAVEDALLSLTNTGDLYAYEIYENTANEGEKANWSYVDGGEGLLGTDCFSNGLFAEQGEEWLEATEWDDTEDMV